MNKEDKITVIEMQKIFNKHNTGLRLGKREFDAINEIIALSLPQEQKDKVTGVSDEEIEKLWEENSVLNNMMGQSFRLMHKEEFVKILKSLLSPKAVEQKGPDGWVCDDMFSTNKDKCIYLQECYKLDDDIKPVYFSPPIQEAEHKQGVTLPDPYSNKDIPEFNTKRIAAYKRLEDLYDLDEVIIAAIFCKGIDWYKYQCEDFLSLPLKEEQKSVTDKQIKNILAGFLFQMEVAENSDEAESVYNTHVADLRSLIGEGKEKKDGK